MDNRTLLSMAADPAIFRQHLLIDVGGTARPLGEVAADFQVKDWAALDPAWRAVAGLPGPEPKHRRGWIERTRGSSKSQDAAISALWLLAFSRRQVHGVCIAADQQQAAIVREAVSRTLALNGWLRPLFQIQKWEIRNPRTGSALSIMASDEKSSWGWLIDFAIGDELSAWPDDGMFVSLTSALAKKRTTVAQFIMNAGWKTSWAWRTRESIRANPRWYFSAQEGHAPWIGDKEIEEQSKLLPPAQFQRLWKNVWSTAEGDSFTEAQIKTLVKHDRALYYCQPPYTGWAIGVDVGIEKHHSTVVTLAVDRRAGKVRVAEIQNFRPPVEVATVERAILRARERFGANIVFYDPSQMISTAQRCEARGMHLEEIHPSGAGNQSRMAVSLLESVRSEALELYDDGSLEAALLLEDLQTCQIAESPRGLKVVLAETPHGGHSDRLSAILQALPDCLELAGTPPATFTEPRVIGRIGGDGEGFRMWG